MAESLWPDLRVEQQFVTPTPVVLPAELPPVVYGVNRQLVWRGNAGNFVGGQANMPYSFPGLEAGAKVERDTATEEILRPRVYISNRFGVAEVSPSYSWGVDPPTFSLSPTLSATFQISDGSTGEYEASSGKFIDPNADFIEDEVASGDKILIGGVPSFSVTSLISDDELDVTKIDKGDQTYSGDLSAEDGNGDRTLTDTAYDFIVAGIAVGDLVEVNFWDTISQADGIEYSAEVSGTRTITSDVDYGFAAAGVQPPITGPPYQTDVVWIKDSEGDWVPAFKVTANVVSASFDAANLITSPAWPGPTETEENKVFEIFHYTQLDLTGGGLYDDPNGDWTADGTPIPGQRTFSIGGGNPNGINLSTLLGGGPWTRYHLVIRGINDAGTGPDTSRPIFKIISIPTTTSMVVENWDPDRPQASSFGTGTTWEIWDDGGAGPLVSFLGADITAEGGGGAPAGERCLTSTYNDFSSGGEDVNVGDAVYSDTGVALFLVTGDTTTTGNINKLYVQNIIPGNPAPTWSDSEFGFRIGADNPVNVEVTRVIDANTLGVRNILSDPPGTGSWTDLYYTIEVPDSLENISYTIEKTISGTGLDGTVLCTFTARRTNSLTEPIEVTDDTIEELLGFKVPINPLALGVSIALENSNHSVYAMQVEDDTQSGWDAAIEAGKNSAYYILAPLTQDENVLTAFRTHVALESDPEYKRERILFQNHLFERVEDRTEDEAGDNAQYTKTVTTTTITVARDLGAYGVIVGDRFIGLDPVFEARIITIVSGATTTMTVVNDNGLPVGGPTAINDWEIKSKVLTDIEFARKIAAYPGTITTRRVRNVYPDSCEIVFTDDTDPAELSGFYGGGDVTETVPGYFAMCIEVGKRSTQRPAQSLTNFPGVGTNRLLNPFGDPGAGGNQDLNKIVLDGGNYLLSQPEEGGEILAIRAITTDISAILKLSDSVTVAVDAFTRNIRRQIRPVLGRYNIEGPFFDLVSAQAQAVIDDFVDVERNAKAIKLLDIREVEDIPDTFAMDFDFDPFVEGARGRITIYV